jgi:acyl carrier protein
MNHVTRQDIEAVVLDVLRKLAPDIPHITMEHRLHQDLKLISDDDAQAIFEFQRVFKVKIPLKEWNTVYTVRGMVNVFSKYFIRS